MKKDKTEFFYIESKRKELGMLSKQFLQAF